MPNSLSRLSYCFTAKRKQKSFYRKTEKQKGLALILNFRKGRHGRRTRNLDMHTVLVYNFIIFGDVNSDLKTSLKRHDHQLHLLCHFSLALQQFFKKNKSLTNYYIIFNISLSYYHYIFIYQCNCQ